LTAKVALSAVICTVNVGSTSTGSCRFRIFTNTCNDGVGAVLCEAHVVKTAIERETPIVIRTILNCAEKLNAFCGSGVFTSLETFHSFASSAANIIV